MAKSSLAEPEPRMQAAQRARRPPVPVAEQPISDGTSSARTIVASISTASTVPTPSSLMKTISDVANAPSAIEKSRAADVTIRPVRSRPTATASVFESPPSCASLMRVSRNTP